MTMADLRAWTPAATTRIPLHAAHAEARTGARPGLVVISERPWRVVYGRPQHLLTRLARDWDVVFVEPPVVEHGMPSGFDVTCPAAGVEVLRPRTPVARGEAAAYATLAAPLAAALRARGLDEVVLWLGTPHAAALAEALAPRALVYDRADAPPNPGDDALVRRADLVLAASPTLHARSRHAAIRAHWVPDAVDADHFAPERLWERSVEATQAAALHAAIPRPRLGVLGVIDERIDLALLNAVAERRPDWQVILAGPELASTTRQARPNVHALGRQSWAVQPYVLAHWDVGLWPLVPGPSTAHAGLARPLEYLAAGLPVVCAGAPDAAAALRRVVRCADGVDAFVAACEAALAEPADARAARRAAGRSAVRRCDWDRGARTVRRLLEGLLRR